MWDAELYNRFERERAQPSKDLVSRLADGEFRRILDAGCGTGLSTAALVSVFPSAEVVGIDLSPEMLKKARKSLPGSVFLERDCGKPFDGLGTFDLVFSNALMQWLPDPKAFLRNSYDALLEGGKFAAQIPLFSEMPADDCIRRAAADFGLEERIFFEWDAGAYYDKMSDIFEKIEIWVTDYMHVMRCAQEILEFLSGTALRPYLEKLDAERGTVFRARVLENLKKVYPARADGRVLFPFRRLFVTGVK